MTINPFSYLKNNGKTYIGFISKALIHLRKVIHHWNREETEIMKIQLDFLGKRKAFGGGVISQSFNTLNLLGHNSYI